MATYLVVIKYDAHMIVIDGFIIFIAIWHKFDKLSHDRIFFANCNEERSQSENQYHPHLQLINHKWIGDWLAVWKYNIINLKYQT